MWKIALSVAVIVAVSIGVGNLPIGEECTACKRPTSFNNGMEVQARSDANAPQTPVSFHTICFEAPQRIEQKVKALKEGLRSDMSTNNADGIYKELETLSLQLIEIDELRVNCANKGDCDDYDTLLDSVAD